MKVLLIHDYPNLQGGAEINMLLLKKGLRERGHEVRLFTSCANSDRLDLEPEVTCFGTTSRWRTLLQSANPFAYFKLRRLLQTFRPDVVYVQIFLTQLSPLILPLLKNVPAIHDLCWYRAICPIGTKQIPNRGSCQNQAGLVCYTKKCLPLRDWVPLTFQAWLYRRWRSCFDLVMANSHTLKKRFEQEGFKNILVLNHAFPTATTKSAPAAAPVIGFIGRLVPEKGGAFLVRAFAQIVEKFPEAKLLIVGDGPEAASLKKLTHEQNIIGNVSFIPHLPYHELDKSFSPVWVQVVPSVWEEPFGNVVVEAMLRGTPVVASRMSGLAETIEHEKTGLLVSPGNVEELTAAMELLIRNPMLREKISRAAQSEAEKKYALSGFIDKMETLMRDLVARRNYVKTN